MRKFEYTRTELLPNTQMKSVSELGREGWEAYAFEDGFYYLKREIEDSNDRTNGTSGRSSQPAE